MGNTQSDEASGRRKACTLDIDMVHDALATCAAEVKQRTVLKRNTLSQKQATGNSVKLPYSVPQQNCDSSLPQALY